MSNQDKNNTNPAIDNICYNIYLLSQRELTSVIGDGLNNGNGRGIQ